MNHNANILKSLSLVPLIYGLSACAMVGPDYKTPSLIMDQQYVESSIDKSLQDIAQKAWWQEFEDPVLNSLINQGLEQNLDIAAAVERIAAARATLRGKGINSAVGGDVSYTSQRSGSEVAKTSSVSTTSLSGDLVIDLFGGIGREQQAATAELQAAIDDSETARLAYLSELVGAYIDARYYQYVIKLTKQSIEARQLTLAITEKQHTVGQGTELNVEQVKALLYSAQADIPDFQASYMAQVYAMATLLNRSASDLVTQMGQRQNDMQLLGLNLDVEYDTGIPADLLRNRPDVRSAEQRLIAATAEVGVATAEMLPSISLSGAITDFSTAGWSFGPTISLPVFNQGALAANRDVKISETKQAEIAWRQAILVAVEDVQAANSAWLRDRKKVDLLKKSKDSYQRALDLSIQTYEVGVTNLLDLLDTDRSLASAQIEFANSLRNMSINWATLQVSLGAGAKTSAR